MACTTYKEHKWRNNVCSECLLAHKEHKTSLSSIRISKSKVSLPIDSKSGFKIISKPTLIKTGEKKVDNELEREKIISPVKKCVENIQEANKNNANIKAKIRNNKTRSMVRNRSSRTINRPLSPPPGIPSTPTKQDDTPPVPHLYHEYDIGIKKIQAYEIVPLNKPLSRPIISSPITDKTFTPVHPTAQPMYEEIPYDLGPLQKKPPTPQKNTDKRDTLKPKSDAAISKDSKTSFFRRLLNVMTSSTTSIPDGNPAPAAAAAPPSSQQDRRVSRLLTSAGGAGLKSAPSLSDDSFSDSGTCCDPDSENTYVNDEAARLEFEQATKAVDALIDELSHSQDLVSAAATTSSSSANYDSSASSSSLTKSSGLSSRYECIY